MYMHLSYTKIRTHAHRLHSQGLQHAHDQSNNPLTSSGTLFLG